MLLQLSCLNKDVDSLLLSGIGNTCLEWIKNALKNLSTILSMIT